MGLEALGIDISLVALKASRSVKQRVIVLYSIIQRRAARPIHLVQNVNDDTVPEFQSTENVALLESLPEKYDIVGGSHVML